MSVRTSSSSSFSGAPSPVATTSTPSPSITLKDLENSWIDSCTYVKEKDTGNSYGCYLFRSCQSCLETNGCMVNDLGVCVSQFSGMKNLATGDSQYGTSYYSEMNYLKAVEKNLSLPKAVMANPNALAAEQNWHFRAGEATYCKADDAVCKDCKANNFWRGNNTNQLSDSRFCLGTDSCVCIQTCEVPSFKPTGCQWKLSQPSSYNGNDGYYGRYYNGYYDRTTVTHLAYWEWTIVLLVIVAVHFLFRCCSGANEKQLKAAREEAVRAVRRELGIPEHEPVTAPARTNASVLRLLRRTVTETTDESSIHDGDNDAQSVKTPRHGDNAAVGESQAVFVEIDDLHRSATSSPQNARPTMRTEV